MESWSWSSAAGGLGFGFDDINFSDRVLCLHIESPIGGTDFKLRKLNINSLVLASKSPFFYKLFKNGMKESQDKDEVTLKINASEESALVDLLKFIYGLSMGASSAQELVNVLMASDKFEVPSCVKHCVDLLLELPMSIETALLYLGLPSSVSERELVQPLYHKLNKYFSGRYSNLTASKEVLGLPLCAIELVLGLDGLRVDSEDAVLDFILTWARLNYPELEERREILSKKLIKFVSFPCVSSLKMKGVLSFSEFDYKEFSKLVLEALFSKDHDSRRRVYNLMPIKVVELELTPPRCVVYLNINKQLCADLPIRKHLYSQEFRLGGQVFSLFVFRLAQDPNFGLFVKVTKTTETCTMDYEFAAMNKSSKEFASLYKLKNSRVTNAGVGTSNLFKMSWEELMSDEREYFIDGVLHLRADITLLS